MEAIDFVGYKDGDGGGEFIPGPGIVIEPANNGWILYWSEEEEEHKEVFTSKKTIIQRLDELL